MALVLGTNCGLVTIAPVDDPAASYYTQMNKYCMAFKITPTENVKITEIGWYAHQATEEANWEAAIYTHNAGNDVPDASLEKQQTNAKGTTLGWKRCNGFNVNLTADITYWIVIQLDDTATTTSIDYDIIGGERRAYDYNESTLQDPWNTTTAQDNVATAIYAVWEEIPPNVMLINIGNAWKTILGASIVIGGAWKNIF